MAMKPISPCGEGCFTCMIITIMVFCIVTFSGTFWLVGFWDCPANSNYYYIQLSQFCYDNSGNQNDDFVSCSAWTTIADDTSGDESTDADAYHSAHGLGVTAFVVAFAGVVFQGVSRCTAEETSKIRLRYLTIVSAAITGLFLFVILAQDSSSWYTDVDNYGLTSVCDSNMTIPVGGWICCFAGFIMCCFLAFALMFPMCSCAGEESPIEAGLMNAGQPTSSTYATTGTVAQPPAVVVVVAEPQVMEKQVM